MAKASKPTESSASAPGKKSRTNLFIENDLVKKLDHIAGMEFALSNRKATRTDIVNEALTDYVAKWEKKNGPIPVK